jgi:glucuronate isomerase
MSVQLRARLLAEIDSWELVDPHTHIDPLAPAATTLADLLGYHYYTELAHSAGLPRERIEEPGLDPREKVRRLVAALSPLDNTVQYAWLIEICRRFFGFGAERLTLENWEPLYDRAAATMARADWADEVLRASRIKAVFLTNDFDDPLEGFDTQRYIPCLRTDDLVFKLAEPAVRERLARATGLEVNGAVALRHAIGKLFDRFVRRGARACAISLPPDFAPRKVDPAAAEAAVQRVLVGGPAATAEAVVSAVVHGVAALAGKGPPAAGAFASRSEREQDLAYFVFWTLAELCVEYRLPFDLMIGVNRRVYEGGVFQGQDLYDSRVSLVQYRALLNAFPQVTFPISVLASVTNQELASHAWIFPNVVTHGHWWYSNTPSIIEHDLAARLEAVPRTKQVSYYSDAYKLEFALPKFGMYKQCLAKVLAERFVIDRGWSEQRAVDLARDVLRGNVERVFGV